MSTQAVIDANSSRTASRSRFNAVKHGFTAANTVLPGEDALAFEGKVALYQEKPSNAKRARGRSGDECRRMALAIGTVESCRDREVDREDSDRARGESACNRRRKSRRSRSGFSSIARDRSSSIRVIISTSISRGPPGPRPPMIPMIRPCWSRSWKAPSQAAKPCWRAGLSFARCSSWAWAGQSHDKFKAIRLLGKQPLQAISSPELREMFLACYVLEPQYEHPFQELRCEIDEARFERMKAALDRLDLASIMPADETAARAVLLGIVDRATERLRCSRPSVRSSPIWSMVCKRIS